MNKLKIAICQVEVGDDKAANLSVTEDMISEAVEMGAEMVVLPEVFNSPYQSSLFPFFAETYPGITTDFLSGSALKHKICLVGGSIIEKAVDGLYNTSFIYDPSGRLIGQHRKIHLFDVKIENGITFRESDTLCAGNDITLVRFGPLCFGVMICFDVRFPELSRRYVLGGAQMLVVPAAFNTVTGPAHWEILMRARAVDNQCYVIAASPARNPASSYQAWGHSMVVDPWGRIIAEADTSQEIIMADIDLSLVNKVRSEMPLLKQRRPESYQL